MKTLLKILAVLAVLAGAAVAIAACLGSNETSEYISLYGDPDEKN